jgi:hypothetical protein
MVVDIRILNAVWLVPFFSASAIQMVDQRDDIVESKRTCFVISPIGAPDSAIRRHADAVYEFIILPAVKEFGIRAYRSDHLPKPGSISEEMFHHLFNDDLCIAVLTGHNPNVFYELAIAQAAGRPVIILSEKGEALPFDIQDLRCVYYDLDPMALCKVLKYAKQVESLIQSLIDEDWEVKSVLPGFPSKVNSKQVEFIPKSAEYGPHDKWMSLLRNTSDRFDAMGISLAAWRQGENLTSVLLDKTRAGCKIRLAMMDPENPCLAGLINEHIGEEQLPRTVREISDMRGFLFGLSEAESKLQVRMIRNGCPHMQLTLNDHTAVSIPYLFSAKTSASPLFSCSKPSPLYQSLSAEFEMLWNANAPTD